MAGEQGVQGVQGIQGVQGEKSQPGIPGRKGEPGKRSRLSPSQAAMYVLISLAFFFVAYREESTSNEVEKLASSNTHALCTLRTNLEKRVSQSSKFLADNPEGVPGIPPSILQAGIDRDSDSVKALAPVKCPPPL